MREKQTNLRVGPYPDMVAKIKAEITANRGAFSLGTIIETTADKPILLFIQGEFPS